MLRILTSCDGVTQLKFYSCEYKHMTKKFEQCIKLGLGFKWFHIEYRTKE